MDLDFDLDEHDLMQLLAQPLDDWGEGPQSPGEGPQSPRPSLIVPSQTSSLSATLDTICSRLPQQPADPDSAKLARSNRRAIMRERKARLCGDILRRGGAANKTKKKSAGGSKSNMSSVSGLNSVGGVDSPLAGPVPSVVQTGAKKVKKQPAISAADAKLTTSEEKKQRRIIRNRQAAQLHRDRKARALLDLQTSLAQKESENAILRATLFKVKSLGERRSPRSEATRKLSCSSQL